VGKQDYNPFEIPDAHFCLISQTYPLFPSTDWEKIQNFQGRFLGLVNGVMIASDGETFAIVNHRDYDLCGP
jgi:hypothetical protein